MNSVRKNIVLSHGKKNFYWSSKIQKIQVVIQVIHESQKMWLFCSEKWYAKSKFLTLFTESCFLQKNAYTTAQKIKFKISLVNVTKSAENYIFSAV